MHSFREEVLQKHYPLQFMGSIESVEIDMRRVEHRYFSA
uniref:Uncharacterized protein n=1 Tax=Ascaris lumbricoides TaxID=6252 RepID=A0A0M3HP22_ASCLU